MRSDAARSQIIQPLANGVEILLLNGEEIFKRLGDEILSPLSGEPSQRVQRLNFGWFELDLELL